MVFGEIVEPSTRALIDDEFEVYPSYTEPNLEWIGDFTTPSRINTLIIVESDKMIRLFKLLSLENQQPAISSKSGNLQIFKLSQDSFIIVYSDNSDLTTGQIVEILSEWVEKSARIYAITSLPIASFQDNQRKDRSEVFVRFLSTNHSEKFNYTRLESPNLVSGLGAQTLSYCHHKGRQCYQFIVYLDASPLDSVSTRQVTEIMTLLGVKYKLKSSNLNPAQSNLYL